MDILNSNSLLNIKQRYGLYISSGNSVGIYTAQNKLKKYLMTEMQPCFSYKNDLEVLVDKIVDRCDDVETIDIVREYFNSVTKEQFILLASSKIRTFFKTARNLAA